MLQKWETSAGLMGHLAYMLTYLTKDNQGDRILMLFILTIACLSSMRVDAVFDITEDWGVV